MGLHANVFEEKNNEKCKNESVEIRTNTINTFISYTQ